MAQFTEGGMSVERLTRYICDRAHGAQGVSESKLTGAYCRGQFEATALVERLATIEDILGDTYDLGHLRELVEADKDGRCVMLPNREHTNEDGENALKSAMNTCYYHNNPVTRYIADAVAEKLTREAALEKEKQDGKKESSQD